MNNKWEGAFNKVESNADIDQAYEKALKVIRKAEIQPATFEGIYSKEEIEHDLKYVKEKEELFKIKDKKTPEQERNRKLATIFEAIIHEHGYASEWFGPEADTIKPSRYDDIKNGVDTIVELQEGNKSATHLAMGIDVTFSHDAETKLHRIKQEINDGHLAEVKYFESEYMEVKDKLVNIPRVVIGADEKTIIELMNMWLEGGKKLKDLGNHPIQYQILELVADQLKTFEAYAKSLGKTELVQTYQKASKSIRDIRRKKGMPKGSEKRDSVFVTLQENLGHVFK